MDVDQRLALEALMSLNPEDQSVAQAAPTSANPQLYLGNEPKEDSASQARRRLQLLQQQVHTVLTENMEYEYHLHTLRERERTLEDERHFLALRLACHMQMTVERPRTAPRGTFALQNDYLPSKETVLQLVQQQQQAYHSARRQLHVLTKLAAMRGFKRPAGTVAPETASASRATLAPELETVANVQKPPSASTARTHLPDGAYLDPPAKRHASADMSLPVETSDVGQHKRKVEDAELLSQISAQPRKRPRLTTDKDSQSSAATHPAEPSAAIPAVQAATPVSQMESPAVNLGAALFPEAPAHVEAASSESKSRSRAKSSPSAGGVKKEASKAKKRAAQLQEGLQLPRDANLRVLLPFTLGTVTVEALGTVVFDREKYHTSSYIFPVGFRCQRIHRSMLEPEKKVTYTLQITDGGSRPLFEATASDMLDSPVVGQSPTACHASIQNAIKVRLGQAEKGSGAGSGPEFFGLTHPVIMKLIQELPGADQCLNYVMTDYTTTGKQDFRAVSTSPTPAGAHLVSTTGCARDEDDQEEEKGRNEEDQA